MTYTRLCAMRTARRFILMALFGCLTCAAHSQAALLGTVPLAPGSTVPPGVVPPGTPGGTLLASSTSPYSFTTTAGTTLGTFTTAVYSEAGGTLDFYYQIANDARSVTSIDRMTAVTFSGVNTAVGYRTDGSTLAGGFFTNGTVAPLTSDRNAAGSLVGFTFSPPDSAKVQPGTTSLAMVISTNATAFAAGNATIIDGGAQTLPAFQPIPIPEPASLALLAGGALAFTGAGRKRR